MEASRDVSRLVEIMAALRDPADGCPWDIEQRFETIAPYTIEEAYEVADAIERRDVEDLREELGDLLLQVVYHAQLAAERGFFDFSDVVEGITRKMVRRHPHVFGDAEARSARSAKGQWERIKAEERAEKLEAKRQRSEIADVAEQSGDGWDRETLPDSGLLAAVPRGFPALTEALKVQQRAARIGFDWTSAPPIRAKIEEEFAEFDEAVAAGSAGDMSEEMGDLLFSLVNLARHHEIDPEQALRACTTKFRARFGFVESELARRSDSDTSAASLDEMEALWIEAKRRGIGRRSPD